jgi:hypothetical protein
MRLGWIHPGSEKRVGGIECGQAEIEEHITRARLRVRHFSEP